MRWSCWSHSMTWAKTSLKVTALPPRVGWYPGCARPGVHRSIIVEAAPWLAGPPCFAASQVRQFVICGIVFICVALSPPVGDTCMSPPTLAIGEHVSHAQPAQRVIVHSVSWTTYEHLLADLSNQSSTRLTYDRGMLEIMCPLPEHEEWNRTIALLVEVLAEEMRIDVRNFGSTTFRRADLARGFEPDSCFYIQHEADISGKSTIDLTVDPPPDLVIEVDVTSGSLDKFPIYAQ